MRKLFLIFLFVMICFTNSIIVFADDSYFDMEEINDEKSINIEILESETLSWAIQTFDVSENGNIAVGMSEEIICIYNKDLKFKKCFRFNQDGVYHLVWDTDNILLICFTRNKTIVKINMDGDILGIYRILDTENNNSRKQQLHMKKSMQINDETYKMKSEKISGYSYLTKIDKYGNETVIVDTSKLMKCTTLGTIIYLVVFISIVISLILINSKYKILSFNKGEDTGLDIFLKSILDKIIGNKKK